ncbi:hypothetical protein [Pedobacter sp. L105]|uniref:hypothetical protein n=1 Tax=Pedobacter sp. L105 TaxID=1641871 RepID=UPI00131B721A|nr:hypothetical protein [Pedobacter sp. L105]
MATQTFALGGIEGIRWAPASNAGVIAPADWQSMPKIAPGTVKFTKTVGTKTSITPEGDSAPFVSFYAPGDGDTFEVGLLEQTPTIVQALFNVDYVAATTMLTYGATEKIANLAFEITCQPVKDGRKAIITIYNTTVVTTYANNLTTGAVEQLLLTATLSSYTLAGTTKALVYTKQWVNEDGTAINSTVA